MNDFQIMLNHRQLNDFTQEDYLKLEERLKQAKTYSLGDYLVQKKLSSNEWTSSYQALHSKTRRSHLIELYRIGLLIEQEKPAQISRLRSLSRKMMRMNPQNIIKCHQVLQNDDFFIVVKEICKERTLSQVLAQGKVIKQKSAIQWIKQIIRGLAQLYKQNIYLPQISADKICLIDQQCKITDFTNIEKKLTLTEADIVSKHIQQIARLFLVMVTARDNLNEEKNLTIYSQTFQEHCYSLSYLTDLAKDFLKKSLFNPKVKIFTWQQLSQHKLFFDQTRRSSNQQFLKLAQIHPQIPFKKRQSSSIINNSTLKETKTQKPEHIDWDCEQYVQIQKVKLILGKIIHDIAEDKVFDITDRQVIEILYLMSVRCLNNLNHFNSSKEKHQNSQFLKLLKDQIEELEKNVTQKFYQYSSMLTEKENQKMQVGKDWLNMAKSIVKLQFFQSKRRNKFLTGIQSTQEHPHDYTKKQQIDFTQQSITNFLNKCKFHYSERDHVFYYLLNYKKIMDLQVNQLESMTFGQKVKEILLETPNEKKD